MDEVCQGIRHLVNLAYSITSEAKGFGDLWDVMSSKDFLSVNTSLMV